MNYKATAKLQCRTPLEILTGTTPGINPLLRLYWWKKLFYKIDYSDFPSEPRENQGHFVDIAENVGHAMIFKILTYDTHKIIHHSKFRNAEDTDIPTLCLDLFDGEESITQNITSESDNN